MLQASQLISSTGWIQTWFSPSLKNRSYALLPESPAGPWGDKGKNVLPVSCLSLTFLPVGIAGGSELCGFFVLFFK